MGRRAATLWHVTFSIAAGVLYFFFVLPRWPELMGDTPHTLGTVARIVTGVLIALAALPVVFTLLRARKPEYGTPQLALTLQTSSVVAHVLAGVLIVGTAISEIWLSLDNVGQWLFGVYGAAAAIALLGIFGFYLSFIAELPPPPPKPLRPKKDKQRRRKKDAEADEVTEDEAEDSDAEADEDTEADDAQAETAEPTEQEEQPAEVTAEGPDVESAVTESAESLEPESTAQEAVPLEDAPQSGLRNRRPSGKSSGAHRLRRVRRDVAVED
jgi:hypothetical protein